MKSERGLSIGGDPVAGEDHGEGEDLDAVEELVAGEESELSFTCCNCKVELFFARTFETFEINA